MVDVRQEESKSGKKMKGASKVEDRVDTPRTKGAGEKLQHYDLSGPIIWAIDPVEKDEAHQRAILDAIKLWRRNSSAAVIPASVVKVSDITWPVEMIAPLNDRLIYMVNQAVRPIVEKAEVPNILEPRMLLQKAGSRRRTVEALLDLAKEAEAGIIAVHAHRRRGLGRLGSFTEALIALSTIPVLVLPPEGRTPETIRQVLFPTDFSDSSRTAFQYAVSVAKDWNAKLLITHSFEFPGDLLVYGEWGYGISPDIIEKYWADAEREQRNKGNALVGEAIREGVQCEFEIAAPNGSITDRILTASRAKQVDLIIMEESRGIASHVILGSIARDVLMQASCPVVIINEQVQLREGKEMRTRM